MRLGSHDREYVDTFESDEVGHVEVFAGEDGYVGEAVDGDERYTLSMKTGEHNTFVADLGCGKEVTLRPVDDGFFRNTQPIPRFIRRLAGLESHADRD